MKQNELRTPDYLQHILEAIGRIGEYTTPLTFETFDATPMAIDAVVRNLEIIGEAARNIVRNDPGFANAHPEIPWQAMYAMRNQISHGYFAVDVGVVWATVQRNLPDLKQRLSPLLDSK
jgi:uncharacterized protein with HEPN domain